MTGKNLVIAGELCQTIVYETDTPNRPVITLTINTPFTTQIAVGTDSTAEDSFCVYLCIENASVKSREETLTRSYSIFVFAHRLPRVQPPAPPVERGIGAFVFYSLDGREMGRVDFDSSTKMIIATSTGVPYNSQDHLAFVFELFDITGTHLKATEVINGRSTADIFAQTLTGVSYENSDIINITYSANDRVKLVDTPNIGDEYEFFSWSRQSFQILPATIEFYTLPQEIVLVNDTNQLVTAIIFDKFNRSVRLYSSGETANSTGGSRYFVVMLLQGTTTQVLLSATLRGGDTGRGLRNAFNDIAFSWGDRLKLDYEEPSKITITNYTRTGETYTPTVNSETYSITENGLAKITI